MVLKKRRDYGFNGFHVPFIPKAPRSARRGLHKRKVEDSQICAFDLLASLAGKLLQESESSASSSASETNDQPAIGNNVFKEEQHEDKPLKVECPDHGSCEESVFVPEFTVPNCDNKFHLKESPCAESDSILERTSIITNSDSSEKASSDVKSGICKSKIMCDGFPCKLEGGSPDSGEYADGYVDSGFNQRREADGLEMGGLTVDNTSSFKDLKQVSAKLPAMVNSENNVKLPPRRDSIPSSSILRLRNNIKLGIRDDDEKFSRYNKSGTKPRTFRHPSRIGDRRIRKLLTSKYWNVAPKLKDCELSKVAFLDGGMKPIYRKRKICYGRERFQNDTLYKRRKFADPSLVVTSDGGFSSESVCNSPEKDMNVDKTYSATMFHANGVSSSMIGHQAPFPSEEDSHVKFSIKSFRIPELFVEVPEATTVGSLKRTVMEAVTAILGGGLRVGVLLQGKKIRDDNKTLLQSGISSKESLDTLGFTLEPSSIQTRSVCIEDSPVPLQCDNSQLVARSLTAPVSDSRNTDTPPDPPALTNSSNNLDSNHETVSSITDKLVDKTTSDSRALVAVPPVTADALAVVPVNQKARRSELVQRRTRRPFSVSEVEALVQAVEELGTGRWRDVKLRSFENADHRTYVDLKDKWKTLVHTAKIAPQQRRGEPVPQELLDRVLAAHAYWSQHQAKQHGKNHKMTEGYGAGGEIQVS